MSTSSAALPSFAPFRGDRKSPIRPNRNAAQRTIAARGAASASAAADIRITAEPIIPAMLGIYGWRATATEIVRVQAVQPLRRGGTETVRLERVLCVTVGETKRLALSDLAVIAAALASRAGVAAVAAVRRAQRERLDVDLDGEALEDADLEALDPLGDCPSSLMAAGVGGRL